MARPLPEQQKRKRFERLVLPHFDAAYNLAIWLVRNEAQAEEAVQEAYLRAFQFFDAFRGEYARPWLLRIVRNTCYTLIARDRDSGAPDEFDESSHGEEALFKFIDDTLQELKVAMFASGSREISTLRL